MKPEDDRFQFTLTQLIGLTTMAAASAACSTQSKPLAVCFALTWTSMLVSVVLTGYLRKPIQTSLLVSVCINEFIWIAIFMYFNIDLPSALNNLSAGGFRVAVTALILLPVSAGLALAGVYLAFLLRLLFY